MYYMCYLDRLPKNTDIGKKKKDERHAVNKKAQFLVD